MRTVPFFSVAAAPQGHSSAQGGCTQCMIVAAWRFWYIRHCINTGAKRFSTGPDLVFTVAVVGIIIGLFSVFWNLVVR